MARILLSLLITFLSFNLFAQLFTAEDEFTRKDSLRGSLTPPRTCYDVHYYDLDIKIDPIKKSIEGSNMIHFEVREDTKLLQVDLFENMEILQIRLDGDKKPSYQREFNAVFITLPETLTVGTLHNMLIKYKGIPKVAKRPPWDGGFSWTIDSVGNPWVAVSCQGTGASLWWPNKDHQSDEPDSMQISVTVPEGLENISNGRLRSVTPAKKSWTTFTWFVSYPINNYNVTINIGKFAHFNDTYVSKGGDALSLDYYVLPQALDKAKLQFTQVKPMMDFFYEYFGPYPFENDGYKLIQSPHLGMEHQTAVAYGNGFLNGYKGTASSEVGLTFDFIILHETAHEWWGNSITTNDVADMWVHESFGAYSEGLYVEYMQGYDAGMKYINGKKQNIHNDSPIIGLYGVNQEGSGDMYDKGQLILNTLRHLINDDELWKDILRGLNEEFRYQSIDGQQVFDYIEEKSDMDLDYFFDQYFKKKDLPKLHVYIQKKGNAVNASYRWQAAVSDFRMPIEVTTAPGKRSMIYPSMKWQTIDLNGLHPDDFSISEDKYLVGLEIRKLYVDPRK